MFGRKAKRIKELELRLAYVEDKLHLAYSEENAARKQLSSIHYAHARQAFMPDEPFQRLQFADCSLRKSKEALNRAMTSIAYGDCDWLK